MGYPSSTFKITGPLTIVIIPAMKIARISIIGRTAIASTYFADTPIAGWPAPSAIDIAQNEHVNDTGANSGGIQKATLTVPAGAQVDVFAETL